MEYSIVYLFKKGTTFYQNRTIQTQESSTYIILTCIASFLTRLIPTQPDYTFNGRLTAIKAQLGDIWCIGDFNDKNELWASMQVVDPSPVETYSRRENAGLLGSHTSPPSLIILCMMCLKLPYARIIHSYILIRRRHLDDVQVSQSSFGYWHRRQGSWTGHGPQSPLVCRRGG